jgi:hypothetical protein
MVLAGDITSSGNYAYVSNLEWGFSAVDVSDPAHPHIASRLQNLIVFRSALGSGYAYLAHWYGGFSIVDISDPENPWQVSRYLSNNAQDFTWVDNNLFVADATDLKVINVADPEHPRQVGDYNTSGLAYDIAVQGSYGYLVGNVTTNNVDYGYLNIIDISDITDIKHVVKYSYLGNCFQVTVKNNYVFMRLFNTYENYSYFAIVDVSLPDESREVGLYTLGKMINDLFVKDNYIYIASRDLGLIILDCSEAINWNSLTENHNPFPANFAVVSAYPNPFNSTTILNYNLPFSSSTNIEVFNSIGQLVQRTVLPSQPAGSHQFTWNAGSFSSGNYFLRISTGQETVTQQVILLK